MVTESEGAARHQPALLVEASSVLSYAMAHNRIPVVHKITVVNPGIAIRAATLRMVLVDATGPVGASQVLLIDLEDDQPTVLTNVAFSIDPAGMLQIEEQRPAVFEVTLESDGIVLARSRTDMRLLAAQQWLAVPTVLSLELLAAFVMPNHPAVTALISEAADLLQQSTGSPSMQGYQAGPQRVDQIVESIYQAMQNRLIRYANPPASWADVGQKIRTPDQVFDGRVGTCLDTVVVMAAALEQAAIRPLLWILDEHAFLGYWRCEFALDAVVQTEVADIVNRIDLAQIRLVETTAVVVSEQPISFADTFQRPYADYLTGDLSRVVGVTDVWRARKNGIVPLPARLRLADGSTTVVEYRPAPTHWAAPGGTSADDPLLVRAGGPAGTQSGPPTVLGAPPFPPPPRVQQWKNALLDLSNRNRLINFSERTSIAIAVPERRLAALEDAVNEGTPINLVPSDQVAEIQQQRGIRFGSALPQDQLADMLSARRSVFVDVTKAAYDTRLRNLAYKAKTIIEETGANNLYLALGFLVWRHDNRDLRSPLILVPVRLTSTSRQGTFRITLDESGSSTPNYCLLERLRQLHGLEVPAVATPLEDGSGIDLDASMRAMREALVAHGLPYRLEDTAALAILQFAKFRLWKDLDEHWETLLQNSLLRHLVEQPNDPYIDPVVRTDGEPDLDELAAKCPVAADASQLAAVAEAVVGRSFVLEGPPGTGKSQTITNLLTRAVAEGKRVLFVAEKRAALDVVRNRLDAVGMGPFSLDLHDKSSKPAAVRSQIRQALEHHVEVDRDGLAADHETVRSSGRQLSRYAQRLHQPNATGLSFYTAHTKALAIGDSAPAMSVPLSLLNGTATTVFDVVRRQLSTLADTADLARPSADHPWGFIDPQNATAIDIEELVRLAGDFDAAAAVLPDPSVIDVLDAAQTATEFGAVAAIISAPPVTLAILDATRTSRWRESVADVVAEMQAFATTAHPGLDAVTPQVLDLAITEIDAQARAAADSSFFGRKKRLLAARDRLQTALRADVDPKDVPALTTQLVQLQVAARVVAAHVEAIPGLNLPTGWNPLTEPACDVVVAKSQWLRSIGLVVDPGQRDPGAARFASTVRRLLDARPAIDHHTSVVVRTLADAAAAMMAAAQTSELAQRRWSAEAGFLGRWSRTSGARGSGAEQAVGLRRWIAFVGALDPLRTAGFEEARISLLGGLISADRAVAAFERGIAESSVTERRGSQALDAFDAQEHERTITRFVASSAAVRAHMATAIPQQVISLRSFDSLAVHGQIGALQRELAKQRRGLGVRGLLHTYGELITQAMPCVLVSPDSLARFFPVTAGLFDIVVFDEASQIRVADAAGAIGRAASVIVVGDSKQMPPTSFAEPASDAGADESFEVVDDNDGGAATIEDEESILSECVQALVPRRWLSWHYRSQDESLIAFSNQQYYENRLSSFPAPTDGLPDPGIAGRGVSLVRVAGYFHRTGTGAERSTNPIEAATIVTEIKRRFAASAVAVPSIGVVTFNIQQRAAIEALIHDTRDQRMIEALDGTNGEGLFVKNLENVQGDERDVIFFSTAFSVNERGALPLNFGPLNREGGERRLNVAITRARRQVVVFSSFDPEQLRADETSSVGIKHLRAYLDMAKLGTAVLPKDAKRPATVDRHREAIADALRSRGFVVRTDVGLSEFKVDLTVAAAGSADRPVMAVLLDGPAWAARRTIGDRDGLPSDVLSQLLLWPVVERVWLPTWLTEQEGVLDRLSAAMGQAGGARQAVDGAMQAIAPPSPAQTAAPFPPMDGRLRQADDYPAPMAAPVTQADAPIPQHSDALPPPITADLVATSLLPYESVFVAFSGEQRGGSEVLDQLASAPGDNAVSDALGDAVEAEGPVHLQRLVRLVADVFGSARLTARRKADILGHLPAGMRPPMADEPFVWPASVSPAAWRGFRRSDTDDERPLEHICLEEIVNAMAALCSVSAGMVETELKRESLAIFGGRRITPGLDERLTAAIDLGVETGRLHRRASGLLSAAS